MEYHGIDNKSGTAFAMYLAWSVLLSVGRIQDSSGGEAKAHSGDVNEVNNCELTSMRVPIRSVSS